VKNVAKFIKARRAKLKITQEELAHRANVGLRFIRELESGKPTVRSDKVNMVLRLFGYTLGAVRVETEESASEAY